MVVLTNLASLFTFDILDILMTKHSEHIIYVQIDFNEVDHCLSRQEFVRDGFEILFIELNQIGS